jgi:hypothetical protein
MPVVSVDGQGLSGLATKATHREGSIGMLGSLLLYFTDQNVVSGDDKG